MRLTCGRASLTAGLAAALLFGAGATRLPAQQQQGGITGTVTDRAGGAPLASVRVTVLNTNRSAFTNQQGKYNLQGLPPGAYQLQASLIGYGGVTNSATVTAGQSATVDFALKASAVSLDVVTVVTPAGEQRARESANATTNIDMTTVVANQTVTTFADAMSGRDAGVQVLQSGGTVGTGTRIRIRGQTSLSLSNEPVYYVDGVRVEGITPQQVHGHFATVTVGPRGTNLDFSATDIKVVPWKPASGSGANDAAFTCEGKFVPMH